MCIRDRDAADRLDDRIARRNGSTAAPALAAQQNIADDGNVFPSADRMVAMRAGRAWNHKIVGCVWGGITVRVRGYLRGFSVQLGALLLPAQFHHFRQTMDDHIEKTADHQSKYQARTNKCGGNRLQQIKETHWAATRAEG